MKEKKRKAYISEACGPNPSEIVIFNADFEGYYGRQRGAKVKELLLVVSANNEMHKNDGIEIKVTFNELSTYEPNELTDMQSKISNDERYWIKLEYNNETGRINGAIITEE